MNDMFAGLKKEFSEKHLSGATFNDINKFCDDHPILRHSKARMDFIAYISRTGE